MTRPRAREKGHFAAALLCVLLPAAVAVYGAELRVTRETNPKLPFTAAGLDGAVFGRQSGIFEAWLWPVKILSAFRIRAELADYPVPIDVNALSAVISVTPGETVITYSHAAFTIRQHMSPPPAGVWFEIESVRPLEVIFSFTPEMLRMWPAPNSGRPSGEWVAQKDSGFYILHTDDPSFSAVVAMPGAKPGILPPYQERPQTYPLELKLKFDPAKDRGTAFPLHLSMGTKPHPVRDAERIDWDHFFDTRLTAETPDPSFDEALRWAEVAIDQAQVRLGGETGLVAGYYESGDSARPGFGWFFGRDTLWTTYAINSYGDFALTRRSLDFLIRRQRTDGKIMHEYSQAAAFVDWKATPYFYASADSTPLFIMAMLDYVETSGDVGYLRQNWDAVRKAWTFERSHDGDGDGFYENTQGTGWVESWPTGMPHQEIYLAALDQQSAQAMSRLAGLLKEEALSAEARKIAQDLSDKLESEYFDPASQFYSFSRNPDGTLDRTASVYPSVAWWDGTLALRLPDAMLTRWASSEFSTDWGTRDISERTPFYDPISYHQGSVWPLFTGWVALAEYRAGRALSGYAHLMQNAGLTWAQDLGSVTELLSGEFFQPLGRSSVHQTWSSAMVLSPALRGLFGLDWDVPNRTLRLAPQLPADWNEATLRNVPFGTSRLEIRYERKAGKMIVRASSERPEVLCLRGRQALSAPCTAEAATVHTLELSLPPVEIAIPRSLPEAGATTRQLKVLAEKEGAFTLAAQGGSVYELPVRINRPGAKLEGAERTGDKISVRFPKGEGYQTQTVKFTW
jgi:hypothetical protein